MATAQTITQEAAAQRIRAAHEVLTPLRAQLKDLDNALADQIVAKELGTGYNATTVIQLSDRRKEIAGKIADEQRIVDALHERQAQIQADEDRARFEANCARLTEIASHNETLEARYFKAAEEMVKVAETINLNRHEMSGLRMDTSSYCSRYGINTNPLPNVREPFQPFEIPGQFLRRTSNYVPFTQWLREWRKNHGITEQKGK